ncbi:hypothetical protein [Nocardia salmonicida]|uniref:hypothetical protein n=1 Tax=Nocardia salmonicida TaxID=53431 RepID=UPI000B2E9597|nr:hypothetical protein [Nocardia salmonicida]
MMTALDPKTIERLARIIVDPDGPYARTGRELAQLLANSGWHNPPDYDGTPRIDWLIEQLDERENSTTDLERLLCRICDRLEHDEGATAAPVFRDAINAVLEAEGLTVTDTGGRPIIAELGAHGTGPRNAEPHDLDARVRRLIGDETTAETLIKRAGEARICQRNGAYTMAVIAIGSFVEGMLLTLLTERDDRCRNRQFVDERGKFVYKPQPNLASLIDTAHACGWIQLDAKTFMHTVRNFRNYIHPGKELADNPDFDDDSVGLCWAPLQAMLNDLEHELIPQSA